jgi:hypothetical protein
MLVFTGELLDIFLITDLKEGDDRALYELIGKMIKPIGQRIELPEVIEQLTTNLRSALCTYIKIFSDILNQSSIL